MVLLGVLAACSQSSDSEAVAEASPSASAEPSQPDVVDDVEAVVEEAPRPTLGELLFASHTRDGVRDESEELVAIDNYIVGVLLPAELGSNAGLVVTNGLNVAVEIQLESSEPVAATIVGDQATIFIGADNLTSGAALDAELAQGVAALVALISPDADVPEDTWAALQELITVRHTLYGEEILDEPPLLEDNAYISEYAIPEALGDRATVFIENETEILVEIQLDSDLPVGVNVVDNRANIVIAADDVVSDPNLDRILQESLDTILAQIS